jgi:MoaA/NifB/PqqE/SkfB family radical SAM enzyme
MSEPAPVGRRDYGPQRLTIELTNICNLHCSYCLRDEDALYHQPATFFSLEFLQRILREAREATGIKRVTFTGGEPTLHPQFAEIISAATTEQLDVSFVTNGWNFEKIWPTLLASRKSITHIAFSIDGVTSEEHDGWRGNGSFIRLVRAFSRCNKAQFPFAIKVGIRRDTIAKLESIAMFAARVGATTLSFSHLLPTSLAVDEESCLSYEERMLAEQEIATLARIFKMQIGIDVGYYNVDAAAPCSPLIGRSCNVDYRGRLSLCCNLSGFRNAAAEEDVVADLHSEQFGPAYERLQQIAALQLQRRANLIAEHSNPNHSDIFIGSPCLLCLQSFAKIPWRTGTSSAPGSRTLPIVIAV